MYIGVNEDDCINTVDTKEDTYISPCDAILSNTDPITKIWSLDAVGIVDRSKDKSPESILTEFFERIKYDKDSQTFFCTVTMES